MHRQRWEVEIVQFQTFKDLSARRMVRATPWLNSPLGKSQYSLHRKQSYIFDSFTHARTDIYISKIILPQRRKLGKQINVRNAQDATRNQNSYTQPEVCGNPITGFSTVPVPWTTPAIVFIPFLILITFFYLLKGTYYFWNTKHLTLPWHHLNDNWCIQLFVLLGERITVWFSITSFGTSNFCCKTHYNLHL